MAETTPDWRHLISPFLKRMSMSTGIIFIINTLKLIKPKQSGNAHLSPTCATITYSHRSWKNFIVLPHTQVRGHDVHNISVFHILYDVFLTLPAHKLWFSSDLLENYDLNIAMLNRRSTERRIITPRKRASHAIRIVRCGCFFISYNLTIVMLFVGLPDEPQLLKTPHQFFSVIYWFSCIFPLELNP